MRRADDAPEPAGAAGRIAAGPAHRRPRAWYDLECWKPVPSCSQMRVQSCDLTMDTLDLYRSNGYRAKVRAVDGGQRSNWTITHTRFSVDEVMLTIGSLKLEVVNGSILGTIQPPRPQAAPEGDTYESIFPYFREYKVSVRKAPDPNMYIEKTVKKESFRLPMNGEVGEFCVKVKPSISSRVNPGLWSSEECVVLAQQYFTATNLTVFFVFVLLLCGAPATCLGLQLYVRGGGKLPAALVFEKPGPLGLVSQFPPPDPIQPLDSEAFLQVLPELRHSELYGSTDSGFGSVRPSLQSQETPILATPRARGPLGKRASLEELHSEGSTDSGVCLQEPSLCPGSEPPWEPQQEDGSRGQDDSGVGLTPGAEEQPASDHGGSASDHVDPPEPGVPEEEYPTDLAFQGYLKQTRGTEAEAAQVDCLEEEASCSSDDPDPKFQTCLEAEVDWMPPALTKGYLKQDALGRSLVTTGASAEPWSHPTEKCSLLALTTCGDLGASDWSFAHGQAPLESVATHGGLLALLDSELASLPFISSLQVDE
ncbi:interleukin-10 receptor subunit alpha isoform X2 [Sorex araneus]|uniref:interleukin-10 receptor subunit alpha isoform X2 n=1 Tax=Sorex araneus TaxID=42254 RepID=UPI00243379CD|nr:interleukin-10 receptor subunit alpha isoform X2 [Sorex araneus]